MSTTRDRSHIGNEWTHDKKLSEVDARSNKWHKIYQNVHFLSFRQLVGLAVGRWCVFFFFFAHGAHESVGKKNFFTLRGWKKKTTTLFHISFDGSVRKPETRLFFYRPHLHFDFLKVAFKRLRVLNTFHCDSKIVNCSALLMFLIYTHTFFFVELTQALEFIRYYYMRMILPCNVFVRIFSCSLEMP